MSVLPALLACLAVLAALVAILSDRRQADAGDVLAALQGLAPAARDAAMREIVDSQESEGPLTRRRLASIRERATARVGN